jgi:hypothetical protein
MAMSKSSKFAAALPPSVRKKSPILYVSKVKKMDKVDGPDTNKSDWIKSEFLMDPALRSKYSWQFLSSRMDAITRGVDQVGDGIPGDWEPDTHEGTCRQDQDVSDFVEGSSLVLFWTSSDEEVEGRRTRFPGQ